MLTYLFDEIIHQISKSLKKTPCVRKVIIVVLLPFSRIFQTPSLRLLLPDRVFEWHHLLHRSIKIFLNKYYNSLISKTHIVFQHSFNAVPKCNCAGITSPTGATQFQKHLSIFETSEFNISSVILNSWSNSGIQEFFDQNNHFAIVVTVCERVWDFIFLRNTWKTLSGMYNLLSWSKSFRDQAKHFRLQMCPVCICCFGNCNKIGPVEHRCNTINAQQTPGKRWRVWTGYCWSRW